MKQEIDYEKYAMYVLLVIVLGGLIFNILVMFGFTDIMDDQQQSQQTQMGSRLSRMSLTGFDQQLARQFMDKDGDGRCDVCGMDVNLCIDSGQLQCNMDPESTIGILGSQHIHADFKVYINGEPIDFAKQDYYMKSSFIHLDDNQNKQDASGVIHMHATGVPLWIFFKSVGLDLPEGMKMYVNGKKISDYQNYVFKDLDKILITDGKGDLQEQLKSITNFAKDH